MTLRRSSRFGVLAAAVFGTLASLVVAVAPAHAVCPETLLDCTPPSNLHGVSSTKTKITVAWDAVENAPGYRLRYSTTKDFTSNVRGVQTTSNGYVLASLQPGTKYFFKVAVATVDEIGQWSEVAKYMTLAPFGLRVGTYNIKDFDSTDPRYPPWQDRGRLSAGAIVGQGVKLAGLQELYESDERAAMLNFLNEKAGGNHFGMVPNVGYEWDSDSQIVYDTRVLEHIKSGGRRFSTQLAGEERAFAWGKFRHVPSGKYVLFLSPHLEPSNDAADVGQWRELLTFARAHADDPVEDINVSWRVVMAGDFNVTKFEEIGADLFAESRAAGFEDVLGQMYRSYDTYRNPTTRVDAWISTSNRGERDIRKYSVSPEKNGNGIDHILISRALKVPYYRVYAQPRTGYFMDYLLSDHFLVIAKVSD